MYTSSLFWDFFVSTATSPILSVLRLPTADSMLEPFALANSSSDVVSTLTILFIRLTWPMLLLNSLDARTTAVHASSILESLLNAGTMAVVICADCWPNSETSGYTGSVMFPYMSMISPISLSDETRSLIKLDVEHTNAISTSSETLVETLNRQLVGSLSSTIVCTVTVSEYAGLAGSCLAESSVLSCFTGDSSSASANFSPSSSISKSDCSDLAAGAGVGVLDFDLARAGFRNRSGLKNIPLLAMRFLYLESSGSFSNSSFAVVLSEYSRAIQSSCSISVSILQPSLSIWLYDSRANCQFTLLLVTGRGPISSTWLWLAMTLDRASSDEAWTSGCGSTTSVVRTVKMLEMFMRAEYSAILERSRILNDLASGSVFSTIDLMVMAIWSVSSDSFDSDSEQTNPIAPEFKAASLDRALCRATPALSAVRIFPEPDLGNTASCNVSRTEIWIFGDRYPKETAKISMDRSVIITSTDGGDRSWSVYPKSVDPLKRYIK
ncbi:hypothetical protein OGAPHI_006895 [Ogataea philodendri]|uniref:Uncharacterized protein n=1 Tax=Ogataea philodendri TaxID=1378263 RepID=A0A9P8NVP9_9ASCO|nr:uncharacterized protein OGAPHI_006895 [Ogataea philodendri]KAH3660309.1 hypothetical protein OGAPHI_006895 [Ogataea philodendri]